MSKYRVTLANVQYYIVDIEADSDLEAEEIATGRLDELGTGIPPYDGTSYVVEGETYEIKEENK